MNVRSNPVIVSLAIEKDPMSLRYVGPNFKDCEETVSKALKQAPLALEFASERL